MVPLPGDVGVWCTEAGLDLAMVAVMNTVGHCLEIIIERGDSQRFSELQAGIGEMFRLAAEKT